MSHIRTAPSPLPLTSAYSHDCTAPIKSWYSSQLPSAYGGVGTANVPATGNAARCPAGTVVGGCDIAQRMSIVITHCPVARSHWRKVLSDAPVTFFLIKGRSIVQKDERRTSVSFSKYNAVTALLCPSSTRTQGPDVSSVGARLL